MKAYRREKQNMKFESVQPLQTNLLIKTQLFSYIFHIFFLGGKKWKIDVNIQWTHIRRL